MNRIARTFALGAAFLTLSTTGAAHSGKAPEAALKIHISMNCAGDETALGKIILHHLNIVIYFENQKRPYDKTLPELSLEQDRDFIAGLARAAMMRLQDPKSPEGRNVRLPNHAMDVSIGCVP